MCTSAAARVRFICGGYIYIYIYRERDVYIYIYIYIYTCTYIIVFIVIIVDMLIRGRQGVWQEGLQESVETRNIILLFITIVLFIYYYYVVITITVTIIITIIYHDGETVEAVEWWRRWAVELVDALRRSGAQMSRRRLNGYLDVFLPAVLGTV